MLCSFMNIHDTIPSSWQSQVTAAGAANTGRNNSEVGSQGRLERMAMATQSRQQRGDGDEGGRVKIKCCDAARSVDNWE